MRIKSNNPKILNVLHISYSDIGGGAAIASFRIHKMFLAKNCYSVMQVEKKVSLHSDVVEVKQGNFLSIQYLRLMSYLLFLISGSVSSFTLPAFKFLKNEGKTKYDAIYVHWTGRFVPDVEKLSRMSKNIFFVFHDCHGVNGFKHYPLVLKNALHLSRNIFSRFLANTINKYLLGRKIARYRAYGIRFIFPSSWLYSFACNQSGYFKNLDLSNIIFYPSSFNYLRYRRTGVEGDYKKGKSICFGAIAANTDERKGFEFFVDAIELAIISGVNISQVTIFGVTSGSKQLERLKSIKVKLKILGFLKEEKVLSIFSKSDIVVLPSLEDNLPNACIESLTVGTPVVSFRIGGFIDMIEQNVTGFLAEPYKVYSLVKGISMVCNLKENKYRLMRKKCTERADKFFNENKIYEKYFSLVQKDL